MAPYKGPQDLNSLLNTDQWSPTSLFPEPLRLDSNIFPTKPLPYIQLIERLSEKGRPDLRYLCSELNRQHGNAHAERSRAIVLEFSTPGAPPNKVQFDRSIDLEQHLSSSSARSCSRLYILEDISANYVEAFGSHFSIEPTFWARHLRTAISETSKTAGPVCALPSVQSLDSSFSLIYPEYTIIDEADEKLTKEPKIRKADSLFADCNLYRKITLIGQKGEFYDGIAEAIRQASVWSRTSSDGSWDVLILIDPPIVRVDNQGHRITRPFMYSHEFLKNRMVPVDISHSAPYQGGYVDFLPLKDILKPTYTGPPRTSLFDDLIYYYSQTGSLLSSDDTYPGVLLLKNIIAGIWMNSINYISMSVTIIEYALQKARKDSPASAAADHKKHSYGGLEWVEENLFHIYGWKRRCFQLHHWADQNLLALETSHSNLKQSSTSRMGQDWLFIKKRLELYEIHSRDTLSSALGLLSLVESHKSVEEAESARVLALLGTVYLPLSLTAGVLSMGGTFTPGQSQFWIFFAVAGPLMVLSFAATYAPVFLRSMSSRARKKREKATAVGGVKRAPTFKEV